MTDIAQLGIQVSTSTVPVATKQLDALTVSATRADTATEALGTTSGRRLAPGMAAGGQQSRMMAMQLSQVAQQASATGNWVQALAIQLPDMALGFGAAGIAAGVLGSVALPLLASMFGSTSGEAERVSKSLESLGKATDAYIAAAEAAGASTDELATKYGRLAQEARLALGAMSDVALVEAITAADAAIAGVADSLLRIQVINKAGATGVFLTEDFGLAKGAADALVRSIQALENSQGLEAQARAAAEVQRQMLAAFGSVEKMPAPIREAYRSLAQITIEAAKTSTEASKWPALFGQAAAAAAGLASEVGGIAAQAQGAATALWDMLGAMGRARNLATMPGGLASQGEDGRGGQSEQRASAADYRGDQIRKRLFSTGGGGGGGGGADPYQAKLDALVENLRSERSIEDEWYQENLAILTDRRAQEILGKQAHDAALLSLHEEYNRRISEIDANAGQQRLTDTANLFGALANAAAAGGQKSAKAVATFQAIEGSVNAYGAALKALNTPGLTLAGRFAAYASVLGAGLRGVAAIRAAGGVAGGGGSFGGGIAAQGATAPAGQNIEYKVYGLERDAVYSGAFIEKIFNGLMEEGKRRGQNTMTVQFV